jgi:hypothetical protein
VWPTWVAQFDEETQHQLLATAIANVANRDALAAKPAKQWPAAVPLLALSPKTIERVLRPILADFAHERRRALEAGASSWRVLAMGLQYGLDVAQAALLQLFWTAVGAVMSLFRGKMSLGIRPERLPFAMRLRRRAFACSTDPLTFEAGPGTAAQSRAG